jgi:hypothetical protein
MRWQLLGIIELYDTIAWAWPVLAVVERCSAEMPDLEAASENGGSGTQPPPPGVNPGVNPGAGAPERVASYVDIARRTGGRSAKTRPR